MNTSLLLELVDRPLWDVVVRELGVLRILEYLLWHNLTYRAFNG